MQVCSPEGVWDTVQKCAYLCQAPGVCVGECAPGSVQCAADGRVPQACSRAGAWVSGDPCPGTCKSGLCLDACTPGETQCSGRNKLRCDGATTWAVAATCDSVCASGNCTGVCQPDAKRCASDGRTLETCDPSGAWQAARVCERCENGSCVPGAVDAGPDGPHDAAPSVDAGVDSGPEEAGSTDAGNADASNAGDTGADATIGQDGGLDSASDVTVAADVSDAPAEATAVDGGGDALVTDADASTADAPPADAAPLVMSCAFQQSPSVRREVATFDGKIEWDLFSGVITSTTAYAVYYDHNTTSTRYVRYDPTQPGALATSGKLFDNVPVNDFVREPGELSVATLAGQEGDRRLHIYALGESVGSPVELVRIPDGQLVNQTAVQRNSGGGRTIVAKLSSASGQTFSGAVFESNGSPATTGSTFAEGLSEKSDFPGTMTFGSNRYVALRKDPAVQDPHLLYKMPAALPFSIGAVSSRVVGPANTMILTAQTASNGADWLLAVVAFDMSGADLRVMRVHAGNVDTWTTADAPTGFSTTNLAEIPYGAWAWHRHGGDDFLVLAGSGVNASGLNIAAFDSSGRMIVRSTGVAGGLLSGLRIDKAGVAAMPDFSPSSPRYLLQWAVQDQLTKKTTIYSDVLRCDLQ